MFLYLAQLMYYDNTYMYRGMGMYRVRVTRVLYTFPLKRNVCIVIHTTKNKKIVERRYSPVYKQSVIKLSAMKHTVLKNM